MTAGVKDKRVSMTIDARFAIVKAMCGRYTLAKIEDLQARFEAQNALPGLRPNFNSAPGQMMPVVTRNSPNKLELMRWGLVPLLLLNHSEKWWSI